MRGGGGGGGVAGSQPMSTVVHMEPHGDLTYAEDQILHAKNNSASSNDGSDKLAKIPFSNAISGP